MKIVQHFTEVRPSQQLVSSLCVHEFYRKVGAVWKVLPEVFDRKMGVITTYNAK